MQKAPAYAQEPGYPDSLLDDSFRTPPNKKMFRSTEQNMPFVVPVQLKMIYEREDRAGYKEPIFWLPAAGAQKWNRSKKPLTTGRRYASHSLERSLTRGMCGCKLFAR